MPHQIICDSCSEVLYHGKDLKPPDEMIQKYDGKCPKCGKKLAYVPINCKIKPAE